MKQHVRTVHPTAKMSLREYSDGSLSIVIGNSDSVTTTKLHPTRASELKRFLSESEVIK